MALEHEFTAINEGFNIDEVREHTRMVKIPDAIIQYFADTFKWIETRWNDNQEKVGLNYYGYTTIRGAGIKKLKKIVDSWLQLFENAPDRFFIRGNYLYDEDEYERIELSRRDVLMWLESLQETCVRAIDERKILLHIGI